MKILVTGAEGQLGNEIRELAPAYPQVEFIFCSRKELDITDETAVNLSFQKWKPDYCINTAAYTAVDKAESDPDTAYAVNAKATGFLAAASKDQGARFIHISTDYVFDGTGTEPYTEDQPTAPVSVYGKTKEAGEQLCLAADPDAVIIRTSWVYSSFGNNFVKTMLRLMPVKESLGVVADQQGCPTYAADLARAIMDIIHAKQWVPGIFHYSNAGITTWFQFASAIREHCKFNCTVNPITTDQYPTPAARPAYSVMSTEKLKNTYGIRIRSWQECLVDCLGKLGCKN